MREAVGGSMLYYIIIPIIILFIVFIAFIMNYAAAYRAANYYITQIESCQGQVGKCGDITFKSIENDLKNKYKYIAPKNNGIKRCYKENGNSYVFRVELPVTFELPIVGVLQPMIVKAETKSIANVPAAFLGNYGKCQ